MAKTLNKFVLDIILTALFILLIYPRQTGFNFHEMAGLASGALVLFHLLLNWPWVKNITRNLLNPKVKAKSKYFYVLNTVSLIILTTIIITGVQISTVLFPGGEAASRNIIVLHKWLSYSCLGLMGIHLALHWRFLTHTVPRVFKSPGRPTPAKLALNLAALVLTLGLLFTQSGLGLNQYTVSSQSSAEAVYNNPALVENRSTAVADQVPTSSTSSSPRGTGRKHSSQVAAAVPPTPSSSSIAASSPAASTLTDSTPSNNGATTDQISLTQYLGNMFCTACSKHCSLLSPQCRIGVDMATTAKTQYIAIYGSADDADLGGVGR